MEKLKNNKKDKGISNKPIKTLGAMLAAIMFLCVGAFATSVGNTVSDLTTNKSVPIEVPASNIQVKNNDAFLSGLDVHKDKIGTSDAKQIKFESIKPNIRIKNPSVMTVLSNDLPSILMPIAVFLIAWRLREIVKRAQSASILSVSTIKDIKLISIISGLALFVCGVAPTILTESLFAEKGFVLYNEKISSLNVGFMFLGVMALLFGELLVRVLKEVVELKEDADATI